MRLLRISDHGELSLTKDFNKDIPSYAILSHTWVGDDDEVTLEDVRDGSYKLKAGYLKIRFCGEQARRDGLQYFWVDTCCIDRANIAELTEAIVSMFRWYTNAAKCYAFLIDVSARKRDNQGAHVAWEPAFRKSRWFTRGWTLQELIAPVSVEFFSKEGERLGDKKTLESIIYEITKIPRDALRGSSLSQFTVSERLRWAEKRDTTRTEDKAYCLLGIFDVFMPPIYGEGENAFARLKDEIGKSYRRQLDGIGQEFSMAGTLNLEKQDDNFVVGNGNETSVHDRRKMLLNSLSFDQMDSRRSTIKNAYSTTCQWFLKSPAYLDWIDPGQFQHHRGFLWIKGKPGVGKSTLVKFALACAGKERREHEILVSFFFNARGDELERSTTGMYQALLHQLLHELPELQNLLDGFGAQDISAQSSTWTLESLRELFSQVVAALQQQQLKCFIDALDECDEEEVRHMIEFFEELGRTALEKETKLYICFASRHYPTIDIRCGRQLVLDDEHGHSEDLAKYIKSHLRAGKGKDIEEVRAQILKKANGIFMWAVLVIGILNKEFLRGRKFAVQKRLEEVPTKLTDLFQDILKKDCENLTDLLLCLYWILFAKRPLTREEFYFAMVSGLASEPKDISEFDPERLTVDDMTRFVLSSSKGLAELTKSKPPTVQFIHESVRDYLVKDNGLRELWPEQKDLHSSGHDHLKRCCWNHLKVDISSYVRADRPPPRASSEAAKGIRQMLNTKFPFLEYASRHVLHHADEAAKGIPQDEFLRAFDREAWLSIANRFERYDIRRHTPDASLVYILAENNFATLLRALCLDGPVMNLKGQRYQYPIFAALANGHRNAVQALLQLDGDLASNITAELEFGKAFSVRKDQTPLSWALEKEHRALAEALAARTDVELNFVNSEGRNALSLAAENGYEAIVDLVLTADEFSLHAIDNRHRTALSYAAAQGHSNVVKQLLDKGANVDAPNTYGKTTMMIAAEMGMDFMVQQLLNAGANLEAVDYSRKTALIHAAEKGQLRVVSLLWEIGARIGHTDDQGKTAFLHAAERGQEMVVQLLLEKGSQVDEKDFLGKTALILAAENGIVSTVQLLLDEGADLEATEKNGKTALMCVAEKGGEIMAHMLLDAGARIGTTDNSNQTALFFAAKHSHAEIVDMLVCEGGNVEVQDSSGLTPLMIAARNRNMRTIQVLLAHDANAAAEDTYGRSPLLWLVGDYTEGFSGGTAFSHSLAEASGNHALQDYQMQLMLLERQNKKRLMTARYGSEISEEEMVYMMKLLLASGAPVNAKDSNGMTAIMWAVRKKLNVVVEQLLGRGADIESRDNNYKTILMEAAEGGSASLVEKLLREGANMEACDANGRTASSWALSGGHSGGSLKALNLRETEAAKESIMKQDDQASISDKVHDADDYGVQHMLARDTNINDKEYAPNPSLSGILSNSVMNPAAPSHSVSSATRTVMPDPQAFIKQQIPLKPHKTSLTAEAQGQTDLILGLVLTHEAKLNALGVKGTTALMLAVQNNWSTIVQQLLTKGVDIEAKDQNGRTALMWAIEGGNEEIVQLLMSSGATIEVKDNNTATTKSEAGV